MKHEDILALMNEPACAQNPKSKSGCAKPQPGATQGGCCFDGARNALLPIVTLLGLSLPQLVGGAYFVEYVFSIPGIGYLTFSSIFSRGTPRWSRSTYRRWSSRVACREATPSGNSNCVWASRYTQTWSRIARWVSPCRRASRPSRRSTC